MNAGTCGYDAHDRSCRCMVDGVVVAREPRDWQAEADELAASRGPRMTAPVPDLPLCSSQWPTSMPDDEFFGRVYERLNGVPDDPDDDDPDPPSVTFMDAPCPVCGADGPCSYDPAGLPLVHLATEDGQP